MLLKIEIAGRQLMNIVLYFAWNQQNVRAGQNIARIVSGDILLPLLCSLNIHYLIEHYHLKNLPQLTFLVVILRECSDLFLMKWCFVVISGFIIYNSVIHFMNTVLLIKCFKSVAFGVYFWENVTIQKTDKLFNTR